jgi:signal transduction histidine kinase
MANRRKTPSDEESPVEAQPDHSMLRRRYAELSRKYAAVVQRLQRDAAHDLAVFRLGLWGLNVTASGLALVNGNQITTRNARWLEMDEVGEGGWVSEDHEQTEPYADLNHLARREAGHLPERAPVSSVRRFRRALGEQVLEVRLERPAADRNVVLVIAHDVTDRVRAQRDLTEMREALLQNEHLAVLGELASSVAHELGNTLRGISARASVLAGNGEISDAQRPLVIGLQDSAESALGSVRKLQELVRTGRLQPGPIHLAEVVRHAADVLQLRQRHDGPRVEVLAAVDGAPPVLGTVSELSYLFITLLFNARDAMPEGGRIEVRAEQSRDWVRVVVADEGPGIPQEDLPRLFQPFFTTKGTEGTGLGLWLARSTMRRLGGNIIARNCNGRGAEFELEFKVAAEGQVTQAREPPPRSVPSARSS